MNLQQLRYVIATAERGTMTAAAASLHVAQPALSRAIRALEQELGITVFARHGRGLRLTDDGRELVDLAGRVMADVEQITRLGEAAALPVCATRGQADELGATAVARQVGENGGRVQLNVVDDREDVFEAVRTRSAQLGVVDLPGPHDLQSISFGWQEFVLVHPPDWAITSPIDAHALDGIPLLFWPPGNWRRDMLESVLRHSGVEPTVSVETTERHLVTRFIVEGAGATVMFGRQAAAAAKAGAGLAHFHPPVVRRVGVVSVSKPTGDAAAFVELLRGEAAAVLLTDDDPRLLGALRVSGTTLAPLAPR
jgi:DNA-binding transcriptional LysR family regulator